MTNENEMPNMSSNPENLPEHPLMAALRDMSKVAMTQRSLKALARIEHGIANRRKWIAARESQIEALESIQGEIFRAYDTADERQLRDVTRQIDQIISMNEGVSAAEVRMGEVMDADEDGEEISFPDPKNLPFKRRR